MSSKLDEHKEMILASLREGGSYASISHLLLSKGTKTTPANVYYWAKNRAAKLLARQQLVDPLAKTSPATTTEEVRHLREPIAPPKQLLPAKDIPRVAPRISDKDEFFLKGLASGLQSRPFAVDESLKKDATG